MKKGELQPSPQITSTADSMSVWYRLARPEEKIGIATWNSDAVHRRMGDASSAAEPQLELSTVERDGLQVLRQISKPRATLVDVGCGGGRWSEVLAAAPAPLCTWDYHGVEIDRARVDVCRKRCRKATFSVGRAEALAMEQGSQDIVLSSGVLQYLPEWKIALREFSRVARGYLAIFRLPVVKHHSTVLAHQSVQSVFGEEQHVFRLLGRDEFEQHAALLNWRLLAREYTDECSRIEGLSERVFWLHYLFAKN